MGQDSEGDPEAAPTGRGEHQASDRWNKVSFTWAGEQGRSGSGEKSKIHQVHTPVTHWNRREEAQRSGTESEKSCSFTRCGLIADPGQVGGNQSSCTGVCDAQVCVCTGVQVSCSREGRGESSSHDRNDEELNHFCSLAENTDI